MSEVEYYDPPKNQMQQLLEELMDRGVIYEWYYNGEYHWSYTKNSPKLTEAKPVTEEDLKEDKDISHKMRDAVQSMKHYRPFKNCEELIRYYYGLIKKVTGFDSVGTVYDMPSIWVKSKEYGTENLITAFDNDNESIGGSCVFLQDIWLDMSELFDKFTFLDGSVCGVEE